MKTHIRLTGSPFARSGRAPHEFLPRRLARRLGHTISCWRERARQRQALAKLDTALLRDIGITHAQAKHEANKPFWKA